MDYQVSVEPRQKDFDLDSGVISVKEPEPDIMDANIGVHVPVKYVAEHTIVFWKRPLCAHFIDDFTLHL